MSKSEEIDWENSSNVFCEFHFDWHNNNKFYCGVMVELKKNVQFI